MANDELRPEPFTNTPYLHDLAISDEGKHGEPDDYPETLYSEGFGHTSSFWNSQPEARGHLPNTFFDTGQVDASLYTYQPLDFDVGPGWPGLAKRLLAVVVVVPVLLLVLLWFIIRGVRRRRASGVSG